MEKITILGIETSCDETAASVVINGRQMLSNIIASSSDYQAQFGGVVPEVAAREHIQAISQVIDTSLQQASVTLQDVTAIAATQGPGLIGSLLVGFNYAKALAYSANVPFIGVNHIHGHIASCYINSNIKPPFLCLIVSGGHTSIILVNDYTTYNILGTTTDDAVGEAYDKVARLLHLPYPGGPQIDNIAPLGNAIINFPMPLTNNGLNFSYSGLKSSVINYINSKNMKNELIVKEDVAASFQKAAIGVIISKTKQALLQTGIQTLCVCGGVAANSYLRNKITLLANELNINHHIPPPILCTDNGAMIAACAYYKYKKGTTSKLSDNAYARACEHNGF